MLEQELDPVYALEQTKNANVALDKQEEVARQLNIFKINLSKQVDTDLTKEFYKLLEETKDENIALKVIFDILKYASKHKRIRFENRTNIYLKNIRIKIY